MFTIRETPIKGLLIIEPKIFGDNRGYFLEVFNKKDFLANGIKVNFVQDNESSSTKGVLRGLHFQIKHPQAKLVRVIKGEVFDVAVDLRKSSPTYGKHFGLVLSESNKQMFFIPKGFAHGFLVLSDSATFQYKCDDFYHPEDEGGIRYDDPTLNVSWPTSEKLILSEKDLKLPIFDKNKVYF